MRFRNGRLSTCSCCSCWYFTTKEEKLGRCGSTIWFVLLLMWYLICFVLHCELTLMYIHIYFFREAWSFGCGSRRFDDVSPATFFAKRYAWEISVRYSNFPISLLYESCRCSYVLLAFSHIREDLKFICYLFIIVVMNFYRAFTVNFTVFGYIISIFVRIIYNWWNTDS